MRTGFAVLLNMAAFAIFAYYVPWPWKFCCYIGSLLCMVVLSWCIYPLLPIEGRFRPIQMSRNGLLFAEDDGVRLRIDSRLNSSWARIKRAIASLFLSPEISVWEWWDALRSTQPWEAIKLLERINTDHLRMRLDQADLGLIRPRGPRFIGAIAAKHGGNCDAILVGIESWVLWLWPWSDSALDHELIHFQQELCRDALTIECLGNSGLLRTVIHWARAESEAHAFGSPIFVMSAAFLMLIR